jgi:hypothetical protein
MVTAGFFGRKQNNALLDALSMLCSDARSTSNSLHSISTAFATNFTKMDFYFLKLATLFPLSYERSHTCHGLIVEAR